MATTRETLTGVMYPTSSVEKTAATRRMFLAAMLTATLVALGQLAYYVGQSIGETLVRL